MSKLKIVLLGIQKIYKDKQKSSTVEVIPLGIYKKCNERLTTSLFNIIRNTIATVPGATEKINSDQGAWVSLYTGMADLFDNDNSSGTSSVLITDVGEYEEIMFIGTVMSLENCSNNDLRFWLNTPELNPDYEKQQNKYKFPEIKPNNTHYTN